MQDPTEAAHASGQTAPLEPQAFARFQEALPFVESIAKKFVRKLDSRHQLDDLVGAGREGLLQACRRFDPGRGSSFKGYAFLRIRGEIVAHLRRTQLSRRAYEKLDGRLVGGCASVQSVSEAEFEIANGIRQLETSEVNAETTLDEALSRYAVSAAMGITSTVATERALAQEEAADQNPETEYEKHELLALLVDQVKHLPADEATVVSGLYFLGRGLGEVAAEMECDKSWASRLHRRAVERLSKRMRMSGP